MMECYIKQPIVKDDKHHKMCGRIQWHEAVHRLSKYIHNIFQWIIVKTHDIFQSCISALKHLSKDLKFLHINCSYRFNLGCVKIGHCNDTLSRDASANTVFLPLCWFPRFMKNALDYWFFLKRSYHLNSSFYNSFFCLPSRILMLLILPLAVYCRK